YIAKTLELIAHEANCLEVSIPSVVLTGRGKILNEIWEEIFHGNTISPNSNFFYLGGSSLDATRMLSMIQNRLSMSLKVEEIYEHPTLLSLIDFIADLDTTRNLDAFIPKANQA